MTIRMYLSDNFPVCNELNLGNASSPVFFFTFALEYATWKVPENQEGLKLHDLRHSFHTGDVNLSEEYVYLLQYISFLSSAPVSIFTNIVWFLSEIVHKFV